ncbi:MAG: hypothetical protein AB7L09_02195 [Nitrospira sp.]
MTESTALQLTTKQVWDGVYKGSEKVVRHCPQCGNRTLRLGKHDNGPSFRRYECWVCTHNMQPLTYRGTKHERKPCGLVIAFSDRDAKIEDYGGVLGQMSRITESPIKLWLCQNDDSIIARGMDVLYEGPIVDVVRRRDSDGISVAMYWRGRTWDQDNNVFHPNDSMFDFARSEAAEYVSFRGFSAPTLFRKGTFVRLWTKPVKEGDEEKNVFKGPRCGKKMAAEIVSFVKAFEVSIKDLLVQCKSEYDRWAAERKAFLREIIDHVGAVPRGMDMWHYNGQTKLAKFRFDSVRPAQAVLLQDLLQHEIPFFGLQCVDRPQMTVEEAVKVEALLGRKYAVGLGFMQTMRFNVEMAKDIAKIVHVPS